MRAKKEGFGRIRAHSGGNGAVTPSSGGDVLHSSWDIYSQDGMCVVCMGTGACMCMFCAGDGTVTIGTSAARDTVVCPQCNGTGVEECARCDGTGKRPLTRYDPITKQEVPNITMAQLRQPKNITVEVESVEKEEIEESVPSAPVQNQ